MDQLTLGESLRDEGSTAALAGEPNPWFTSAWQEGCRLARLGEPFTADHITAACGEPLSPGSMGGLLLALRAAGIIRALDEWRPSTRPSRHANRVRVWMAA